LGARVCLDVDVPWRQQKLQSFAGGDDDERKTERERSMANRNWRQIFSVALMSIKPSFLSLSAFEQQQQVHF
jgi:hypothetical protein